MTPAHELIRAMNGIRGKQLSEINLAFYVYRGEVNRADSPLELHFTDGHRLFLWGSGGGQAVTVHQGPWIDPFESETVTPENQSDADSDGKWTRFATVDIPNAQRLIGSRVEEVGFYFLDDADIYRVAINTDAGTILVTCAFDENEVVFLDRFELTEYLFAGDPSQYPPAVESSASSR